ncbi:SRPBCC family protein [Microbacterium lacticum]|uniref:SRPBCC family protein n=1 Tax=Microbacterium lacticum TaxID=33885 RepID=UPI001141CA30
MVQIIETIDVDVPAEVAYNQWTQFESFPHFLDEVESITQIDDTHNRWKVRIGGVERDFKAEITEQHPDERVAWRSTGGDTDHAGVVTFHRLSDASTRVAVQLEWQPEGCSASSPSSRSSRSSSSSSSSPSRSCRCRCSPTARSRCRSSPRSRSASRCS